VRVEPKNTGTADINASATLLLRPVAQLYGQVRSEWNQCFVKITPSSSHRIPWIRFTAHACVLQSERHVNTTKMVPLMWQTQHFIQTLSR